MVTGNGKIAFDHPFHIIFRNSFNSYLVHGGKEFNPFVISDDLFEIDRAELFCITYHFPKPIFMTRFLIGTPMPMPYTIIITIKITAIITNITIVTAKSPFMIKTHM